ncbi:DUF5666 domain-containing protein [Ramlibacter sp.]|uniref:DUF5666 domain-containing protein n=1 Tax=Ramlibacter sp. TaxID=1917967 RepID=UPI0026282D13|nr:DUF5666 domain-containing protein [Ramlibacter sp.]MDB5956117.1 hypothetical protein [Ramlibacter sp.]
MCNWKIQAGAIRRWLKPGLALAVAAGLAACGGGGGSTSADSTGSGGTGTTASPTVVSSGVITAFGSVFVNGHRFGTNSARVIDDDTGVATAGAVGLEVGMVVDVRHRDNAAEADELHVHPLVRGFIDAADTTTGRITVMGQTVQLSSATGFSDHRACLTAATPCTAIATAAGLGATTGAGSTATPGSFVTVNGFLFNGTGTAANVVATLVSVADAPTGASPFNFKAEGVATVTTTGVSINGLRLDLSHTVCVIAGQPANCTGLANGQVVSAGSASAPALPATVLAADRVRQSARVEVEAAGNSVELEGVVSTVGTGSFVVRGITVNASALPAGTALPAVGDEVRVLGTLSATGDTLQATSLAVEHQAQAARLALLGDVTSVTAGAASGTFTVTVLGQPITVNAQTRLADMSVRDWDRRDPTVNAFNITSFASYLAASVSQHVQIVAESDASGALVARSLTILPAATEVAVAGPVDASPAPVGGTPTVFFVHGIRVSAAPSAIVTASNNRGSGSGRTTTTTVAAGDQVVVTGTLSAGSIVVAATPSESNRVLDVGTLRAEDDDHDRGLF